MSLESDVASVLTKNPSGLISFSLDQVVINHARMALVAKAIETGDVAVRIGNTASLGAAYNSFTGRRPETGKKQLLGEIVLSQNAVLRSQIGRAGIFHESVHASFDVKPTKIDVRNGDEAVAYIADAMYLMATHANANISGAAEDMAIYTAAFALIEKHKMLTKHAVALKWSDCDDLLSAINTNSHYRSS
jgi:hypothetical protein